MSRPSARWAVAEGEGRRISHSKQAGGPGGPPAPIENAGAARQPGGLSPKAKEGEFLIRNKREAREDRLRRLRMRDNKRGLS